MSALAAPLAAAVPATAALAAAGEAKASGVNKAKELPKTSGATPRIAGVVGALLVGGGLLIRRLSR